MSAIAPIVFVVDDDLSHLSSMARLLRASGFSAQTFSSAAAVFPDKPFGAA